MKLSVLFVDDDSNIIGGLRRMMYPMKKEWDLFYANGGKEAQELMSEKKIDVIISDIRMPGIDGTQLLRYVKENYPQTIRITLSGYANDNLALMNTRVVHQSLSKPTTPENIKTIIEGALSLRQQLKDEKLLSIINNVEELPSLPEVYIKLEEEINSENSSIDKLSQIISQDPIITAKILQLTNSAFFGLPNRITNISQALNYLGINIIKNLVLSIKLFKSFDSSNPNFKLYETIWNHSNSVAFIAKQVAKVKNLPKPDSENAYLGGLLHDIGKLIIIENSESIDFIEEVASIESKINHPIHADIGGYLLGIWGLPDTIVECVAKHHSEISTEQKLTPAIIVNISNRIAKEGKYNYSDINETNIDEIFEEICQ